MQEFCDQKMQELCDQLIKQSTEKNCTALSSNYDYMPFFALIDFISVTGKTRFIIVRKYTGIIEATIHEKSETETLDIYNTNLDPKAFINTETQMQEIIEAMAN